MSKQSMEQIEKRLLTIEKESDPFITELKKDERKSVQNLLEKWQRKLDKARLLEKKFFEMNQYEKKYRTQGFQLIAGVDEVGRGPLAGPVAAAAVILPEDFYLAGIDDSKKLSEKKREEYAEIIRKEALSIGIAMIDPAEIDAINIYEATKKAMMTAIAALNPKPDFVLIDAVKLNIPFSSEAIIKGDAKSISIAAASIIAKTARDSFMKEISKTYPMYRFEKNMGYGTKEHIVAIQKYGISPCHRRSFSPVKDFLQGLK